MPRLARRDAFPLFLRDPRIGAIQHVIGRGIERPSLARDDADRSAFVERLKMVPRTIFRLGRKCRCPDLLKHRHQLVHLRRGEKAIRSLRREVSEWGFVKQ